MLKQISKVNGWMFLSEYKLEWLIRNRHISNGSPFTGKENTEAMQEARAGGSLGTVTRVRAFLLDE